MDLHCLGLSADEEELYRYFLRHPGESVPSICRDLRLDRDTAEAAVEQLAELGLLDLGNRYEVRATAPSVGIERLIDQRLAQLNEETRRVLAARTVITSFEEDRREAADPAPSLDIERVEGIDRVRQRLDDLAFFAYEEILCVQPGGALAEGAIEAARPLDIRALRRGLRLRTVVQPAALADARLAAYFGELAALGAEIRVSQDPVDRLLIYDQRVAVVPVDPRDSSRGALLVREPGLVSTMATHFAAVWESAADLGQDDEETPALTDVERQVLQALAGAGKDELAARRLGVSVRTYRRYVADLMARLGANSRFQAAILAKERGWI